MEGRVVAVVFFSGFAVQQILRIVDPFVIFLMNWLKAKRSSQDLPGAVSDTEWKTALMALLSLLLGMAAVGWGDVWLLKELGFGSKGAGDFLISSLVVGTGTEASNTVLKFFSYVKQARRPAKIVSVEILTPTVSVRPGESFQFSALVEGAEEQAVEWTVLHKGRGDIDETGLFVAPDSKATVVVRATSVAYPTRQATATVTVE